MGKRRSASSSNKSTGKKKTAPEFPVGNRLQEFLDARQLSHQAFSKMTSPKISKSAVQRHATGESQMTIYHMEIYARALGIFPEELLPTGLRLEPDVRAALVDLRKLDPSSRRAVAKTLHDLAEEQRAFEPELQKI